MRRFIIAAAIALLLIGPTSATTNADIIWYGPTPYLSSADSPFDLGSPSFWLEDFEDGMLNTPGVTNINGEVRGPSGLTDSVDGDDGAIDGSGNGGYSFLQRPGVTGVEFVFDASVLGGLPRYVGIVSTDGWVDLPANTVEFYDGTGLLLGTLDDPVQNSGVNTTDDDRFLGVFYSGGISRIRISNLGTGNSGMEVDHLQYGSPVPEPSGLIIYPIVIGMAFVRRRRGA